MHRYASELEAARAAIEIGVDVTMILRNLELSPQQRSAAPIRPGRKSSAVGLKSSAVKADTSRLLQALLDAGVEFVVIGGTAALAHGAMTPTQDLDVAAPLTEENLRRLLQALAPFHPRHATRPDLGVVWQSPAELTKFRLLLLDTDIGRLDVLGRAALDSRSSTATPVVPAQCRTTSNSGCRLSPSKIAANWVS